MRLARVTEVLSRDVNEGQLAGAVVAVARRGRLIYYQPLGYLDPETKARMPIDAIFSIASMTKPFTGVATLILQEDGRLHLADRAAKYLPALAEMQVGEVDTQGAIKRVPLRSPISIHDLLRHTAGMAYAWEGKGPVFAAWPNTPADFAREDDGTTFLAKIARLPLVHQPSTVWEYSVANDVLGLLVEAVANQPLDAFLAARVFGPLGMTDTGFVIPADKISRYARALPRDPATGRPQQVVDSTRPFRFACGGACAVSTAADYLRFAQMLLDRGRLGETRILGRKSVELMTSDHLGVGIPMPAVERDPTRRGARYGLTVAVRTEAGVSPDLGSVGEFGWGGAYGTQFWVDPKEQLAVVFMAHIPGARRQHYRQLIGSLVLQAIND
jgi:CubicO group peptidase (beta-lactamase class C family)